MLYYKKFKNQGRMWKGRSFSNYAKMLKDIVAIINKRAHRACEESKGQIESKIQGFGEKKVC